MSKSITIQNIHINIRTSKVGDDFICLTDMAKSKNPGYPAEVVRNWLKTRYTVDFMGSWEKMHNPSFNLVEFDHVRNIRDYASIEQLLVLANMESINAEFIRMELIQKDRLLKLNQTAIVQIKSLLRNDTVKNLEA